MFFGQVYKADLVRKLRAGQVVFQIFASEDALLPAATSTPTGAGGGTSPPAPLGSGTSPAAGPGGPRDHPGASQGPPQAGFDLWTADPWSIVASLRPGSLPLAGERLEGLSMGGRALTQLRAAVEGAAGPEAAAALTVVLHVNDGQREAVVRELAARRLYGIRRDSLYLTVQRRRSGYR